MAANNQDLLSQILEDVLKKTLKDTMTSLSSKLDRQDVSIKQNARSIETAQAERTSLSSNLDRQAVDIASLKETTQLQTLKNDLGLPDLSSKLNNQLNTMTNLSSKLDTQDESIKQNVRSIETAKAERTSLFSNLVRQAVD